jgi:hypothetical protein
MQKIAWYSISVLTAVLLFTAAKTYLVVTEFGWQRIEWGLYNIAFSAIAGIGPLIFRKDKTQAVHSDERDCLFNLRASSAGFGACYCYFVAAIIAILESHGFNGTISVAWLIILLVGGYIIAEFVHAIAILTQYGWRKKNE